MRFALHIPTSVLLALASSCGFVDDDRIDGPYRLVAVDVPSDATVCYTLKDKGCIGRVPNGVFAVGFNPAYIVAARHPGNDESKTEFFYIDRALDGPMVDPSVTVKGPFTREAFAVERARLSLPEPE